MWRHGDKLGGGLAEPGEPWVARWVELSWLHQARNGTWLIEPGPRYFPQLVQRGLREQPRFGRPSLVTAERWRCEFVVRCIDIAGVSQYELTRRASSSMVMPPSVSNQRNWVRRAYRAGRDDLRARGILPWAAFGQGLLPADWWADERFGWAVDEWRREAITWPADSASTTYERVMARTNSAKQAALAEIDETPWQPDAVSLGADEQERGFHFSATIDAQGNSRRA